MHIELDINELQVYDLTNRGHSICSFATKVHSFNDLPFIDAWIPGHATKKNDGQTHDLRQYDDIGQDSEKQPSMRHVIV